MSSAVAQKTFNLRRRFAVTSLVVIALIAIGLGTLMSSILTKRMLQREGEVSMDFIQNLLDTDRSAQYFAAPGDAQLKQRFLSSMEHLASMNEPIRANAYTVDGTVLWSTDAGLIGRRFEVNDELDEALAGRLVVHSGWLGRHMPDKGEHIGLSERTNYYVESYMPVLDHVQHKVVGVMELYKIPVQLNVAIQDALWQIWLGCVMSAMCIFFALYWIVHRAENVMRQQQAMLAERQTLAGASELAQALAHNLRNPLASVRVSAEMLQQGSPAGPELEEHCQDITASVDRADRWISELVRVTQAPHLATERVDTGQVVRDCLDEMRPLLERQHIRWHIHPGDVPMVQAHTAMLRQILISILANAIDVMPQGGQIVIDWKTEESALMLSITDSGPGIADEVASSLFRPFFSTKSGGLGIGLALTKRMLEHWGGQIHLANVEPHGTRVELRLPRAAMPTSH